MINYRSVNKIMYNKKNIPATSAIKAHNTIFEFISQASMNSINMLYYTDTVILHHYSSSPFFTRYCIQLTVHKNGSHRCSISCEVAFVRCFYTQTHVCIIHKYLRTYELVQKKKIKSYFMNNSGIWHACAFCVIPDAVCSDMLRNIMTNKE